MNEGTTLLADVEKLSPLPRGWAYARIKDICTLINGRAFKPSDWSSKGLPIVRIQNLNEPDADFNYCDFPVKEKFLIDSRQLLFAWSGTPETSFGAHIWNRGKAVLNQHIFRVEIEEDYLVKNFMMHLLNHNVSEYIRKAHGTAGLAHITKGLFENSVLSIPPFNEQRRIVAKVEELFTKLDAGVKSLATVKAQLKRYRQSVLKSAFEGKLTEEWRQTHRDELEPASKLLERIKEERRKSAAGKYRESPPVDTSNLPELPEGWIWTRVGEVAARIQYGSSEKATEDPSGIPVLRMGNIQEGKVVLEDLKYFSKDSPQLNDVMLDPDDVLFNRTNSAELVGKTAVYEHWHPRAAFASYLIRVKVNGRIYDPHMLAFFINSYYGRRYIASVVSQQVGQANVNGTKLSLMPIPLTSLPEQEAITQEIKRRFSVADEVEKTIVSGSRQSEKLRQSVLKRAFEGKLVPQDPSDEPASILLERIRSLRAQVEHGHETKRARERKDTGQRRLT